jgi:hypothetical protein
MTAKSRILETTRIERRIGETASAAFASSVATLTSKHIDVGGFVKVLGGDLAEPKLASHPGIGEDDATVSRSAFTARALRPSSAQFNLTSKP